MVFTHTQFRGGKRPVNKKIVRPNVVLSPIYSSLLVGIVN
ncbi:hypothetical protein GYO_3392 [Bacillus spizizenii TU-B-10]|uniref:Uncharacterized protein n=1 Tax=Bacillus spizizenii (strain DSM 15029 / JCM 12233 / NBRC 101239 / NRRL B-23049 / TU-B-10) TaxID=1052585 RepID=G4NZZ2_BACS4|nr:hypothetical protein GYO_3392 [Bacillus spizizenii TU-B-10]